jgi:TrmH family RNA methyltransferase
MALNAGHLKDLRALQTPKGRREHGCFLIEGEKLIREAVAAGAPIVELLATEARATELALAAPQAPTLMSPKDAERLSDTRTPQGCFAVLRDTVPDAESAIATLPSAGPATVVALDGVQDPGNAGALIRVAAAFGAALVLAGPGSADPVQPKVTRAATGAWFHVTVARSTDLAANLATLAAQGFDVLGASPQGASIWEPSASEPVATPAPTRRVLVLGSEGGGFSAPVEALLTQRVGVPIAPSVESLNVAVAAGIILGAWSRIPSAQNA